jgi:hypothetical protein
VIGGPLGICVVLFLNQHSDGKSPGTEGGASKGSLYLLSRRLRNNNDEPSCWPLLQKFDESFDHSPPLPRHPLRSVLCSRQLTGWTAAQVVSASPRHWSPVRPTFYQ